MFIVRYDLSLPLNKGAFTEIDPKNIFNIDPVRILYYMKEHLRTIDLFLKVDTDGDNTLSREEMKYAFEVSRDSSIHNGTCVQYFGTEGYPF